MPIDIATGAASLEYDGVTIRGRVPLSWAPRYSTGIVDEARSPIGRGWFDQPFCSLRLVDGGFVFTTATGALERFNDPEGVVANGGVLRNLGAYLELFREATRYVIRSWDVGTDTVRHLCFDAVTPGEPWRLTAIEDACRNAIDLVWEPSPTGARLVTLRQQLEQREFRVGYDLSGLIERLDLWTARDGQQQRVFTYEHDSTGNLTAIIDAAGLADRFEYDSQGRVTREINKDGAVVRYVYDASGRCVLHSGLNRYNERRLRFIPAINVTEVTNSHGLTTTHRYLSGGQIILESDTLGIQRSNEYDEHGRILSSTDGNGDVTRYGYDERGNRNLVIDPLGNTTKFAFNERHQPVEMLDAAGGRWTREYDEAGRLVATSDPLGGRWLYRFDEAGQLVEVRNPTGAVRRLSYNAGVLASATDWMGHESRFAYDAYGQITRRHGPVGDLTELAYDSAGNVIEIRQPDGTVVSAEYDAGDNLTRLTDAGGRTTQWRYGPCRRVLERRDALGHEVRYRWGTEAGELEAIINEKGEPYTFERDIAGRVVAEVAFDGGRQEYRLDDEGRTRAFTNAVGEYVEIDRDFAGQIVAQRLPDGEELRYRYDALGELVEAVSGDTVVSYERDALSRVVREVQGARWIRTTYDSAGGVLSLETSEQFAVRHQVDANSQIIAREVLGQTLRSEFDANGHEVSRILDGGGRLDQRYDVMGRLTEQVLAPAIPLGPAVSPSVERRYTYGRDDNLLRVTDARWGRVDYVYDPIDELVDALRARGRSEHFDYDATGNLTRAQRDGVPARDEVLIYGRGDHLLQQGATSFEFDAEGRLIRRIDAAAGGEPAVWHYEWNALGRLKALIRPDGQIWRYRYDALARRVAKICDGVVAAEYLWDRDVILHELLPERPSRVWLWEDTRVAPVATVQRGRLYGVVTDQIGTPRELIDDRGEVVRTLLHDSWGALAATEPDSAAPTCDIRFQGQWADAESGLHYSLHRYYDPSNGRFISFDPIGLDGGLNAFDYAPNPIGWVDPLGLCSGNSGRAARAQHGYVIIDTQAAGGPKVVKVGVSGQPVNSNGSPRANNQVNRWNNEPGNAGRYRAEIRKQVPAGSGARQKILTWEQNAANRNRSTLDPARHKRP